MARQGPNPFEPYGDVSAVQIPAPNAPPGTYGASAYVTSVPGAMPGVTPISLHKIRTGERFNYEDRQWRDLWAAILFYVHLAGMAGLAVYLVVHSVDVANAWAHLTGAPMPPAPAATTAPPPPPPLGPVHDIADFAPQLAAGAVASILTSILWLQLLKLFPRTMLWVSLLFGSFLTISIGGALLALAVVSHDKHAGGITAGCVFILVGLLQLLFIYFVRSRIPFTAVMLQAAVRLVRLFPSMVWVAYLGMLLSCLWIPLWVAAVSGAFSLGGGTAWVAVPLTVSLYWTMEVIKNVVHVTVAGTAATFYFHGQSMPPNPTGSALGRASGRSFGSICLGSLVVTAVRVLRTIAESVARGGDGENPVTEILACVAACILSCLEGLIEFFNKYAYIQIALYGKPFVAAARDTWELLKAQGLLLIINDDLTSMVLGMGALVSGLAGAALAAFLELGRDAGWVGAIAIISLVSGIFLASVPLTVVDSTVATLYVCYAEDPAIMQRINPELNAHLTDRLASLEGVTRGPLP